MNTDRILRHTLVISCSFGLLLYFAAMNIAPESMRSALVNLLLLPFGLACPLVSFGCLLHGRFEGRRPRAAFFVELCGVLFFWMALAGLFWLRSA